MSESPVALSVVIAAIEGASAAATVDAVLAQGGDLDVEILVVANPGWLDSTASAAPGARILVAPQPTLVPHLWGLGLSQARGSIVALTIAGCVPEPGWLNALLAAYTGDSRVAAVGGPILPAADSGMVDRAVVFTRYGPYLPPVSTDDSAEVPGDNGSYRRMAIAADLGSFAARGFWEADVNAALRRRGAVLRMAPGMRMRYTHSFAAAAFCQQRWQHGRIFGAARRSRSSMPARVVRAAAFPLIAVLMTMRAARHASRGRLLTSFVIVLPVVLLFYLCWTAGEASGMLRAAAAPPPPR
jgi:hypothetical protein